MAKYFIIIYPHRPNDKSYWENISPLCNKQIDSSDSYSEPFQINNDFLLVFYQTKGNVSEESLSKFFGNIGIQPDDEIIIFGHEYGGRDHPGITEETLKKIKNKYSNLEYRLFSTRDPDVYPCEILYCLNNAIQQSQLNFQTLNSCLNELSIKFNWDTLKKEVKKKGIIEPFSFLKHRIGNLLLSIDTELQAIGYDKSREEKVNYLEEILKNKNKEFYRQKLADLWFMVVKGKIENNKWKIKINNEEKEIPINMAKCVPVKPRENEKELLIEDKAIIDLIDKEKQEDEEVKKYWKNLLKLCGLNYDEDNPFDKSEIYPLDSPILQFMCYLDSLIEKGDKLSDDEKRAVVIKVINFDKLKNFLKKEFRLSSNLPFHDWFFVLLDCLDKLREKILIDK